MKKLFSLLVLFAIISFTIYGFYIYLLGSVFNRNDLYRLPAQKAALLVLGSSHMACDINDTLLDSACNLAQPGDVISNSYDKLRKFLPLNPNVHTVLLGCSEGDISQAIEEDEDMHKSVSPHIGNYFYLMTPGELFYMLTKNPKEVIRALISIPRSRSLLAFKIIKHKAGLPGLNLGKYQYIEGRINYKKELAKFAKNNFDVSQVSKRQVDYLHKTVELCTSRNIKLILVRTPEHKIYVRKNETIFLALLHGQFGNVSFKDYADMNIPDSLFEDHDHLNNLGAILLTDSIKNYLKTIK
jgi:hypothetical protein